MQNEFGLIVSDIHIFNYPDYNIHPGYRLNQCMTLAKCLIEQGQKLNTKILFIAGDISEKSLVYSDVEHTIKEFFLLLETWFDEIYYILGQHDMNTKSDTQNYKDSFITAIATSKMKYSHRKLYQFGNTTVAMMNWTPSQDLSWFEGTVDLLIGHYTLSSMFGQDIDKTRFHLGIFGDIHKRQQIGNCCSVGSPIQNKFGDQIEKTIMYYNFMTHEHGWIDLDPNFDKFLTLRWTSDQTEEGFVDGTQNFFRYKPREIKTHETVVENSIEIWNDIDDLIEKHVTENRLQELHNTIKLKTPETDNIDFNFRILSFRIKNYRSIREFEIDFTQGDKVAVFGLNGSGKSSFTKALRDWLFGNRFLAQNLSFDADSLELSGLIEYQGMVWELVRGTHNWGLRCNDDAWLPYNNKSAFDTDVYIKFPFLHFEDLVYFDAKSTDAMGRYPSERKMEIVSKMYRLDQVDALWSTGVKLSESIENEAKDLDRQIQFIVNDIKQKTSELDRYKEFNGIVDEINQQITEKSNLKLAKEKYKNWQDKISAAQRSIKETEDTISNYRKLIETSDPNSIQSRMTTIADEISKLKAAQDSYRQWVEYISKVNSSIQGIQSNIDRESGEMQKLHASKCYICESVLNAERIEQLKVDKSTKIQGYELQIAEAKKTIEGHDPVLYRQKYEELTQNIRVLDSESATLKSAMDNYNRISPMLLNVEKSLTDKHAALQSILSNPESDIEIPEDIDRLILSLSDLKTNITIKFNLINYISQKEDELQNLKSQYDDKIIELEDYRKYNKLMSKTGAVCKGILERLASNFSDSAYRYYVAEYEYRKTQYLELKVQFNVRGRWVEYATLSSGQQILCGTHFLSKILINTGVLILDEFFKHLDNNRLNEASEMLAETKVNLLINSIHSDDYTLFTKRLFLALGNDGITEYKIA